MDAQVPRLVVKKPARSLQLLGLALPGLREVAAQVEPYTAWWDDQNQTAAEGSGPLLVAIGDSTAIGIGASRPERSYIGQLAAALALRDGRPWRVVNLAMSGARMDDALDRQLPVLEHLHADVVICCVGTNDLVWGTRIAPLREKLRLLVGGLPDTAVAGILAGGSSRARLANRALRNAAAERQLPVVDPWSEPKPPGTSRLGPDRFHPNDLGYRLMALPFARHLDAPLPDDELAHPL